MFSNTFYLLYFIISTNSFTIIYCTVLILYYYTAEVVYKELS